MISSFKITTEVTSKSQAGLPFQFMERKLALDSSLSFSTNHKEILILWGILVFHIKAHGTFV